MLGVLLIGLNEILFVFDVLLADLSELLRSVISLVLKTDSELLRIIFFIFGVFVVGL